MKKLMILVAIMATAVGCVPPSGTTTTTGNNGKTGQNLKTIANSALALNAQQQFAATMAEAGMYLYNNSTSMLDLHNLTINQNNTVTSNSTTYPKTTWDGNKNRLTINYGTKGSKGYNGRTYKGKMFIDCNGHYQTKGSVFTITFDSLYVGTSRLEGVERVENIGKDSEGNSIFDVKISDGKLSGNNSQVLYSEASTRTWMLNSKDTTNSNAHKYNIVVKKAESTVEGQVYQLKSLEDKPIVFQVGQYPSEGELQVTLKDAFTYTVPGLAQAIQLNTYFIRYTENNQVQCYVYIGLLNKYVTIGTYKLF